MRETMRQPRNIFTKRLSASSATRTPRPCISQYSNNHNKEHPSILSLSILDYVIRAATVPPREHVIDQYYLLIELAYIILYITYMLRNYVCAFYIYRWEFLVMDI
ncbi:uncharacterized protein NEPG_02470 [Nematocida parisii ERTm1]|uniref:Uncharacterized protein n=1 Tax=Nematocida parisii (strain ERTm3) TaxID=935791 RepID=I3EJ35_NEMP3|nr:uncharacterized protein NEPG_02470 [Nematocida parisii ERTm1]EIJ89232.1 hypothetical protein NEQG_00002 [Nematocida parisii ERTm3]EIJ92582.1 hypothetical protein NEPG_02470 [Nematocida parisii ERTm1]|eukprot:XP_013060297.1 hypothetical protein NEPG_02470 [Nematocida parisii ERTm1]